MLVRGFDNVVGKLRQTAARKKFTKPQTRIVFGPSTYALWCSAVTKEQKSPDTVVARRSVE